MAIVQGLLNLVGPDRVYVRSSEPCMYRTTAEGLAALADTLRNRCVNYLEFDTDQFAPSGKRYSPPVTPSAQITLWIRLAEAPTTIDITLGFSDQSHMLSYAHDLTDFVKASFTSTAAVYGGVSSSTVYYLADGGIEYETIGRGLLPWGVPWPVVRRFAGGAFWANAIGDEICKRLGGQERVLADAPALIHQPLGSGVWLQLSSTPPASEEDIDGLVQYLAPVLDWTEDDTRKKFPRRGSDRERDGIIPWISCVMVEPMPATSVISRGIPLRILENDDHELFVLNIHLAEIPTQSQCEETIAAIVRWYDYIECDLTWRTFRDVRDIVVNGRVIRWAAETRRADVGHAIQQIRKELGLVDSIDILEIVIGEEMVG